MPTEINIDLKEFDEYFGRMRNAARGYFKKELAAFLEALGDEFLRLVQDEITRRQVIDTRNLLSSFTKGSDGNIWRAEEGGLVLEVGTNVKYAKYVEYGHKQRPGRFVPGHWEGDRFIYIKGAKEGMVLKASWVDGKHYFDGALHLMEKIYPEMLEAKLKEWLDDYFGG